MDLRVLEYFVTAAEEENISHAAQILHVSQPTVSRQLAELEHELGKKLFERTNKKISLTADGVLFKETASNILMLYEKAKQKNEAAELTGDYYIGAAEIESFEYVAGKIREFQEKHPKVRFHILSENAEHIRDGIHLGTLDLGFIPRSVAIMKYEFLELPFEAEWGIAVRRDHPLAQRPYVTREELKNEKLILPENSVLREELQVWQRGSENACIFYTLVHNALILTEAGAGLTVCLKAENSLPADLVFVPFSPGMETGSMLIWKKDAAHSPVHQEFLRMFL